MNSLKAEYMSVIERLKELRRTELESSTEHRQTATSLSDLASNLHTNSKVNCERLPSQLFEGEVRLQGGGGLLTGHLTLFETGLDGEGG